MKKTFMLLAAALLLMPLSCTKPDDGQGEEPEVPSPAPGEEAVTYKPGDYYKAGLAEGVVVYVDEAGEHGLIISMDETKAAWSTGYEMLTSSGGEFSIDDGAANTKFIKGLEGWKDRYPAFAWCDGKNALGLSSWYLPSLTELAYVNLALDAVNATLAEKGAVPLSSGASDCYWTSVEVGAQSAYPFSFYYGDYSSYDTDKKSEHFVRAMRKF